MLPSQEILRLIEAGAVAGDTPIAPGQVQPASVDLRLGARAFRLRAAFRPGGKVGVREKLAALTEEELDLGSPAMLERGGIYLVPLGERLALPEDLRGRANPKSTTGRLGALVRLVTGTGTEFDAVPPGYAGPLYALVTPRSFSLVVAAGTRLNQLRFIRGTAEVSDDDLVRLDRETGIVYHDGDVRVPAEVDGGLRLTLDLAGSAEIGIVGYRARANPAPIDLAKSGEYDPEAYWEAIRAGETDAIALDPGDLWILATKEKVRVPPGFSADMVVADPGLGEYRSHSSGFFDPGFGYGNAEVLGTRAVIQVRSYDVPLILEHGQTVARLVYERMSAAPDAVYGTAIASSYQSQPVALSKQFRR